MVLDKSTPYLGFRGTLSGHASSSAKAVVGHRTFEDVKILAGRAAVAYP